MGGYEIGTWWGKWFVNNRSVWLDPQVKISKKRGGEKDVKL